MDKFSNILKQALSLKSFETADTDMAWADFMSDIDNTSDIDLTEDNVITMQETLETKKKHNWYRLGMIAASFLTVFAVSQLKSKQYTLLSFATTTVSDSIVLPDGSLAYLDPNSSITYPATFNDLLERHIALIGDGRFNVSKNKFQPFRVQSSEVVTEALGTIFGIIQNNQDLEITNLEGSIKVFIQSDPSKFFLLEQGESINYANGLLVPRVDSVAMEVISPILKNAITPKPTIVTESTKPKEEKVVEAPNLLTFTVETVVKNQLLKLYKKKVKLARSAKFTGNTLVKIDVNKSLIEILKDLQMQGFIEYKPGDCEGCYIITKGTK